MPTHYSRIFEFWKELKRRKVIQVVTVYAASAFVILELADILAPSLRLPDWTINLVLLLLCVGFVIAVIVSWIYDIHPEGGIVKTESVEKVKGDIPKSSNSWKIASYISFGVIVGLIVLNIFPIRSKNKYPEKSIAVLPFINDSPDETKMYFINGTMEAIMDNLCKIEDMRVVSRTSVEQYRNNPKPVPVVAREMNVDYILEGSGYRDGDQVRLIVQLLDGGKDQHLWSKTYDTNIKNVFSMQSEIAQQVAVEVQAIITPKEKALIEKVPTDSQTAYDLYMKACQLGNYKADEESIEEAIDLSYYALEYDSTFANPYAMLSHFYSALYDRNRIKYASYLDSIIYLANKSLYYDNELDMGFFVRGDYYYKIGEYDKAIEEFDKAIELNPNYPYSYTGKGWAYFVQNDYIKSIESFTRRVQFERGPELPGTLFDLGKAYNQAGFHEKFKELLQERLTLDGDTVEFLKQYSVAELTDSKYSEALEMALKANALDSSDQGIWSVLGNCYYYLRQFEEAYTFFDKYVSRMEELNQFIPYDIPAIAYTYLQIGENEKSDYYLDKLLKYNKVTPEGVKRGEGRYIRMSQIYAMKNDSMKMYQQLSKTAQLQRFSVQASNLKDDPTFNDFRSEPEFIWLTSEIERKYNLQQKRIRQWLEENEML